MTGADVPALLSRLEAAGARLEVQGGALTLTGKRPPAALLSELRDRKADVLAWLTAPGTGAEVVGNATTSRPARGVPLEEARARNAHAATLPGHCGTCARAAPAPEWGPGMVTCGCPPAAWRPVPPPLALHPACRCGAYLTAGEEVGRGWKARPARRPRPTWEDAPGVEGGAA